MKTIDKNKSYEVKILKAFKNSKFKYRTASGISKETKIPTIQVEKTLLANPSKFRVSLIKRSDGSKLFASADRVSAIGDVWSAIKAISKVKFEK